MEAAMGRTSREEQLVKIEQAEKKLQARKQRINSCIKTDGRKQDTRRKILIGSHVLKQASDNPNHQAAIRKAVGQFSERDQAVFDSLFEQWE